MENKNEQLTNVQDVAPVSPIKRFNRCISSVETQQYLSSVLMDKKGQFVNNITALVANDVKLQECRPMSLIYAGIKATALDLPLDPNLGFAYVIPYKNTKTGTVEAQFQIGYRGFIQLAIRSGLFSVINVTDVREGEMKSFDLLTGEIRIEAINDREKSPTVGYVAYFRLNNGKAGYDSFSKSLFMSIDDVKSHAMRYSKTFSSRVDSVRSSSKWATDFDAMAKKTVLKLLLARYAPLSVQMQDAVKSDQAVIGSDGSPEDYIDGYGDEYDKEKDVEDAREKMRSRRVKAPELL